MLNDEIKKINLKKSYKVKKYNKKRIDLTGKKLKNVEIVKFFCKNHLK
jgi:hypothetical protein